jgi:hypothetical protein
VMGKHRQHGLSSPEAARGWATPGATAVLRVAGRGLLRR